MNSAIGSIPLHKYLLVDSRFSHQEPDPENPFIPAVWFGLRSKPGEMWKCHVLFEESGAWYRDLPPHALAFPREEEPVPWGPKDAQVWDCYGTDWTAHIYTYLNKQRVKVLPSGLIGTYLFTVAPLNDGFSDAPDQTKEFSFIELDNGRLTIQPTNRFLILDRSFTAPEPVVPRLKLQTEVWSCED
jgi:hypothetical protein